MASNARPNKPGKYVQGYYQLQNIEKYIGNPVEIIFRSSYERRFCFYCDLNPKIVKWGSEISTVPYSDPEGKTRQYHIDFYVELETLNPEINKKMLIEVKPEHEITPPKKPAKINTNTALSYGYALKMYQKNLCKWHAAKQYAIDHGMQFVIVTEKHLNMIK